MKLDIGRFVPILVRLLPTLGRFVPFFFRLLLLFERFIPFFVSYFLNRTLRAWKARGLIDNYVASIVRLGKLSYKIDIRIVLTKEQAKGRLNDLVAKVRNKF